MLDRLAKEVAADPRGWIAQRPVALSTSPTLSRRTDGQDGLAPRHIDLRPFAVHDGSDVWLVPGGLTRVALGEGNLIVDSSQGGGSKDTWVLAPSAPPSRSVDEQSTAVSEVIPRQFGPGIASTPGGPAQEEAQQQ